MVSGYAGQGRVLDEKVEGLPGTTVLVKGTTIGTNTTADGRFSLNVPDNATLVFSSVGYATQEVVGSQTTINVILRADTHHLFLGGAARRKYASSPLIRQTAPSKVRLLRTMGTWPQPCRVS